MNPSTHRSRFRPHRVSRPACLLSAMLAATVSFAAQTNRLVKLNSPDPAYPYATWDTAAHDIQTAIDAANEANGDEVVVAPGVYDTGAHLWLNRLTPSRIVIDKDITVRSRDNDPETTIIQGAPDPLTTNGVDAVRAVTLASADAMLIGFTLTGGATRRASDPHVNDDDWRGGGLLLRAGIASNCVVALNFGHRGGGVYFVNGQFTHGTIANNYAFENGGGLSSDNQSFLQIFDSLIVSNTAYFDGGGSHQANLLRCTVAHNRTETNDGAGARSGSATNSVFYGNVSAGNGGGVRDVDLFNCLVYGNEASFGGGGVHRTIRLYNSTVVGNLSGSSGGGVAPGGSGAVVIENSIVVGNASQGGNPNRADSNLNFGGGSGARELSHSCIQPLMDGVNMIDDDPLFVQMGTGYGLDHVPGDYRLAPDSPCLNTGLNDPSWMLDAVDLDGNPRIDRVIGIVDMGAFERVYHGTTILVR